MKEKLSKLGINSTTPSAVNQLTTEFAEDFREGTDINLGVGYVNDKTIPADAILQAFQHIIKQPEKYRNALNYGGSEGSPNLRRSIKNYYLKYAIGELSQSDFEDRRIVIGANGATSLLDSLSDLFEPGIVITADPFYYIFTETLERKGYEILPIAEDNRGIIITELEKAIESVDIEKISFFYIVTVNNPSTVILSNDRRKAIVKLAQKLSEKTGKIIPVIFDKAYEDIIHNPAIPNPVSGIKYDKLEQVYEIGTLSKIIAPALRIGYAICPDKNIAKILIQRTSDIGFSAPLINQEISSWLLDNYIEKQKVKVNKGYQEKSTFIKKLFKEHLSEYIESYSGGDAAFYFYITLKNIPTDRDSDFFKFLSRTTETPEIDGVKEKNPRLVYIPGTICSKEPQARYQLRISYGFEENEVFVRAVKLIAEACRYSIQK
ncbi:MAG: PLP-dependent aminotransferase family protein [Bacteroidales bacterium]|nr:PLP-dependent aminotransferase family protein [Bacteroidales bacterium]MBN2820310.1 PLP-dependent aminotransferase family protein [Bacteroidales bacterium]